jgi:hypothetical protein
MSKKSQSPKSQNTSDENFVAPSGELPPTGGASVSRFQNYLNLDE